MNWLYFVSQIVSPNDIRAPKTDLSSTSLQSVFQIVFGVLGALAVFMISFGAFRFVISRGNPDSVAKARNTIIYSVVGLLISLIAFSIVTFVVGKTQ